MRAVPRDDSKSSSWSWSVVVMVYCSLYVHQAMGDSYPENLIPTYWSAPIKTTVPRASSS